MNLPIPVALRVALAYGVIGMCWILFTDQLLHPIFSRSPFGIGATWWQSFKGLFFVGLTSLLLYSLLVRQFGKLTRTVDRLRESEDRWQRLLNQTPQPVLILDGFRVLYTNRAGADVLGAEHRDEVIGKEVSHVVMAGSADLESTAASQALEREKGDDSHQIFFINDMHGEVRRIEAHSSIISFEGRQCLLSVWLDITNRHDYEQQLLAARNEAEKASRLKSTILANLSHEIRTPLTAILGFAELLNRDPEAPVAEGIELIHRSGIRLKETLESILTLADFQRGDAAYQLDRVDIRDVVRSTAEIFVTQAERKGLTFQVQVPDKPVEAMADPTALAQIVLNLVSNAVKFTFDGGITVCVSDDDTGAVIEVRDTGIGIDETFLPRMFDEFAQQSQGLDREFEGSGLGLTIVRQLVELQAGSIQVDSRGGRGTRIAVELPAAP